MDNPSFHIEPPSLHTTSNTIYRYRHKQLTYQTLPCSLQTCSCRSIYNFNRTSSSQPASLLINAINITKRYFSYSMNLRGNLFRWQKVFEMTLTSFERLELFVSLGLSSRVDFPPIISYAVKNWMLKFYAHCIYYEISSWTNFKSKFQHLIFHGIAYSRPKIHSRRKS